MAGKLNMDADTLKTLSEMLKALGHPSRIAILWLLCNAPDGKLTVKSIYEALKMTQPSISRHLGILKACNLLNRHKKARTLFTNREPATSMPPKS
jgi:DNA-binding transcriptional ArsR family regulator